MILSQSKSILAKLLAEEDINVQHKNVSTAYFELKNRTLVCPIWKDMTADVYDLLMGHEVGHALFTPAEGWHNAIDKKNSKGFKTYLNVVEDARIERMIRGKFPGLRKSFYSAYRILFDNDFFGVKKYNLDVEKLPLIDRINLHFKLGSILNLKFNTAEQYYVDKVDTCQTWSDVEKVSTEIYDYAKKTESNLLHFDIMDEMMDQDGEDADSDYYEEVDEEVDEEIDPISITDQEFRNRESDLREESSEDTIYLTLPKMNWRPRIIGYKTVYKNIAQSYYDVYKNYDLAILSDIEVERNKLFSEFKKKNEKYVAYMVKEFELRKNAQQFARAAVSKTGELDTKKLFSYKIADDLFKRMTIIPNGKNHGLIMFIDFSMSMHDHFKATIEQTILLAMFCRKINIPFHVYSFTNAADLYKEIPTVAEEQKIPLFPNVEDGNPIFPERGFRLREYINSRMSSREFKHALKVLLLIAESYTYNNKFVMPYSEKLNSTPLDEAIIAAIPLVKEFKKVNKLDIVNTIFLSDGESDGCTSYNVINNNGATYLPRYSSTRIITDPETKLQGLSHSKQPLTCALLQLFKQLTDSNVVGFFLAGNTRSKIHKYISIYSSKLLTEENFKKFRKQKYYEINGGGYDSFFILTGGKDLEINDDGIEVSEKASKNELKKAFILNRNKKNFNRMFLNRFAEIIS